MPYFLFTPLFLCTRLSHTPLLPHGWYIHAELTLFVWTTRISWKSSSLSIFGVLESPTCSTYLVRNATTIRLATRYHLRHTASEQKSRINYINWLCCQMTSSDHFRQNPNDHQHMRASTLSGLLHDAIRQMMIWRQNQHDVCPRLHRYILFCW
jgi:hypothetical protein